MEGQERLFNELTHKWLECVRHFYLHSLPPTERFRDLQMIYYDLYFSKAYERLNEFRTLLREEGY